MKLIPFGTTLAGLTLKGNQRDVAEAHYNLDGESLERRLIELNEIFTTEVRKLKLLELDYEYDHINEYVYHTQMLKLKTTTGTELDLALCDLDFEYDKIDAYSHAILRANILYSEAELTQEKLKIDLKYEKISQEEYDIEDVKLTLSDDELEIELLNIERKYKHITKEEYDYKMVEVKYRNSAHDTDLPFARYELDKKYGKLTEKEFDKAVYSLGNRPWVDIVRSEYKDDEKSDGFTFELDWNDAFVKMLRSEGYNGGTDEAIVEQWFEDKSLDTYLGVLSEQLDEIGDDPEDAHKVRPGSNKTFREQLEDKKSRHS